VESNILFQTSLIAAFLAGMVALFAPCCISYLLPAYLGSVFKERKRVLLMTLIYSLGIFAVMIPAVLGANLVSTFVFRYHVQIYVVGGIVMLIVGLISLLGLKLPMPNFNFSQKPAGDVGSIFTLGVFSGITSACCAPVLIGVMTLSFLSPSLWQALLIGFVYVLGMVAPLYVGAYFLDTKKVLGSNFFKKHIGEVKLFTKSYHILMGNLLSFIIFTLTGILVIYLALATDFTMPGMTDGFATWINNVVLVVNNIPFIEYLFGALVFIFMFIILRASLRSRE
jgi:cytochrome c-type biogenesis protein